MRQLIAIALVCGVGLAGLSAADKDSEDTPKAAQTRKLLKSKKVTVEFSDDRLEDVLSELKDQTKVHFTVDSKGGVSRNQKLSYTAKNKPLDEVLDKMLKKNGLGYIVISKKGDAYDGTVQIRQGNERGYPKK